MLTKTCINPKPLSTRSSLDTPITCSFHCMYSSRIYFIVQKVPPPPPFAPPQPLQDETSWLSPLSSRSSTDELDKRAWLGLLPARMVRSRPYLLHNQGLAANPGVRDREADLCRPAVTFVLQYKGVLGDRELDIFISQLENYMSVFLSNEHRM